MTWTGVGAVESVEAATVGAAWLGMLLEARVCSMWSMEFSRDDMLNAERQQQTFLFGHNQNETTRAPDSCSCVSDQPSVGSSPVHDSFILEQDALVRLLCP